MPSSVPTTSLASANQSLAGNPSVVLVSTCTDSGLAETTCCETIGVAHPLISVTLTKEEMTIGARAAASLGRNNLRNMNTALVVVLSITRSVHVTLAEIRHICCPEDNDATLIAIPDNWYKHISRPLKMMMLAKPCNQVPDLDLRPAASGIRS